MMWLVIAIIAGVVIFAFLGKSGNRGHRHYCDTCRHGIWNRGKCYCDVRKQSIHDIKSNAGCSSWVSRR